MKEYWIEGREKASILWFDFQETGDKLVECVGLLVQVNFNIFTKNSVLISSSKFNQSLCKPQMTLLYS